MVVIEVLRDLPPPESIFWLALTALDTASAGAGAAAGATAPTTATTSDSHARGGNPSTGHAHRGIPGTMANLTPRGQESFGAGHPAAPFEPLRIPYGEAAATRSSPAGPAPRRALAMRTTKASTATAAMSTKPRA